MTTTTTFTVSRHFERTTPAVAAIYRRLLAAARKLGPFTEDPKKTSIHLVRKTAFAGITTRQTAVLLTVKAAADIRSPRIAKHERASAHRWHLVIRLEEAKQVDAEIARWLKGAYALGDS